MEERFPPSQAYRERIEEEAMPTSLACGIVGTPPGEVRLEGEEGQVGRSRELEGEQMRAPGEGEVADAVHRRPGASGSQPDLASDLDRYVPLAASEAVPRHLVLLTHRKGKRLNRRQSARLCWKLGITARSLARVTHERR